LVEKMMFRTALIVFSLSTAAQANEITRDLVALTEEGIEQSITALTGGVEALVDGEEFDQAWWTYIRPFYTTRSELIKAGIVRTDLYSCSFYLDQVSFFTDALWDFNHGSISIDEFRKERTKLWPEIQKNATYCNEDLATAKAALE
jgi:hypothetical protein